MVNLEGAGIKRRPPTAQDAFERVRLVGSKVKKFATSNHIFMEKETTDAVKAKVKSIELSLF